MADPRMNNLLKWSIENSSVTRDDPNAPRSNRELDPEALRALLDGMTGPSDAEMMLRKMAIIMDAEMSLEDRVGAFDDFEMLIENLDNANNMENLGLWTKLVEQLDQEHAELRKYAAWCAGTAVENNVKAQERVCGCFIFLGVLCNELMDLIVTRRRRHPQARQARDRRPQPGRAEEGRPRPVLRVAKPSAQLRRCHRAHTDPVQA